MANYLYCDVCGTEKTGFGTLWFCPKCEPEDSGPSYDDRLYFLSIDKIGDEAVLGQGTAVFVSRESAQRAIDYLRKYWGGAYNGKYYLYSFRHKDLKGWPILEDSAPTGGEECQVVNTDLIGLPVEYVTML